MSQPRPSTTKEAVENKKKAKIGLWIGGILSSLSLLQFLIGYVLLATSEEYKQGYDMSALPHIAVTITILIPILLIGLTFITYGILKLKNIKHAVVISILCLICLVSIIVISALIFLTTLNFIFSQR